MALPVTSLAASRRFWQQLGFELVTAATFPHEGAPGRVLRRGDPTLGLYQLPALSRVRLRLRRVRQRGDGRIDHLAFEVDDADQAYAPRCKRRVSPGSEPSFLNFRDRSCWFFNIAGPDGERLEFCRIL